MSKTPPAGFERFELVERIAVGGMAEVFRANKYGPHGFAKELAVKRILPALAADSEFVKRFIAEAKIAVTLSHANIVQVFDFSRFGDSLYIAMEYVDGVDLAALLATRREAGAAVGVAAGLHIAMGLLAGLESAHERGVVHRDVSPSNVLLSRAGEVKIADFGIARATGVELTRRHRVMGKWPYMSPEQTRGDDVDHRSDLFSAGTVIYELVTGRRLFRGVNAHEIGNAICTGAVTPPSRARPGLPDGIDEPIMALLERDRDRRADAAGEVLAALVEISYQGAVQATAASLARELDEPPAGVSDQRTPSPAQLIDDIINSELTRERSPGGRRVTEAAERLTTGALSFVKGEGDAGELSEWLVGDETRTYTLAETERLLALAAVSELRADAPPVPAPARSRWRSRVLLGVAAVALAAVGAAAVAIWIDYRRSSRVGVGAFESGDPALEIEPRAAGQDARTPSPERGDRAALSVMTEPAGASVDLDGDAIGETPIRELLLAPRPGKTRLTVRLDGYRSATATVELIAGAAARVRLSLEPEAGYGTIDIDTEPWSEIYFRGRKIGVAPARGLVLPHGTHQLTLINPAQKRRTSIEVSVPGKRHYRIVLPP